MTKKTPKLVQYVAPTIEQYKKMTAAQKRVTIAKDVVAALNSKIYIANHSQYIKQMQLDGEVMELGWMGAHRLDDIQQALPKIKECEVCAMGACIMSITKYENRLTFDDIGKTTDSMSSTTAEVVQEVFSANQLAMIEIMFEGYYSGVEHPITNKICNGDNYGRDKLGAEVSGEDAQMCMRFHSKYDNDDKRMRAIMQHIVDNAGDIVPSKLIK